MSQLPSKAPRRRAGSFARWTLTLGALLVGLSFAELTLRLLGLPRVEPAFQFVRPDGELDEVFARATQFVADPELFWKQAPGPHPPAALVNHLGLRGHLPQRAKRPRDLRVACVGDSCTFGMGVRYEDAYGMQLEQRVQAARQDLCVEAMLIGLPGYSTYQSRVLFARHARELAPDVTILYCGAWNDYLPAVGRDDVARARAQTRSLRLLTLLDKLSDPSAEQLAFYRDEFRAGRAPCGRRVPLAEFRSNLQAIVATAREVGSRVVVVVPPVPAATAAVHTIGAEYRACLRELAAREQVPLVDAEALFAARTAEPLFLDWVHPTPRGHVLLADELTPVVLAAAPTQRGGPPALAISHLEPSALNALVSTTLTLSGPGLGAAFAFDRLFVGERWMPDVQVSDVDRVEVRLNRPLAPGRHTITLRTAAGCWPSEAALTVRAPTPGALRAALALPAAGPTVQVAGTALAEMMVSVWLATRRSATPRATPLGDLHLAPVDPAADWPEPVLLDTLTLPRFVALSDGAGGFALSCPVPPELARPGATVFVQAAVFDPYDRTLGALTEVVEVRLPE